MKFVVPHCQARGYPENVYVGSDGLNECWVSRIAPFSHDGEVIVPEPSAVMLFALGCLLIAGARFRLRQTGF